MSLSLHNVRAYLAIYIHGNRYLIGGIAFFYINMSPIAGELEELSVSVENGNYGIRIVMVMDAAADYVYRVITDNKHVTDHEIEVLRLWVGQGERNNYNI